MRVRKTGKESKPCAKQKAKVIVAEINGQLIAFVVDHERPIVRIPIGELDLRRLPAAEPHC